MVARKARNDSNNSMKYLKLSLFCIAMDSPRKTIPAIVEASKIRTTKSMISGSDASSPAITVGVSISVISSVGSNIKWVLEVRSGVDPESVHHGSSIAVMIIPMPIMFVRSVRFLRK